MGEGPPAPLGCLDGRSPARTCRPTHADRRTRLRLRFTHLQHPLFQGIPPSLSWRNTGASRSPCPPNTRVVARISSADAKCRTRPANPVDLPAKPRATGRCEARVAVLTERRRRCVHPAPILPYSRTILRLGRPCVVGGLGRFLLPLAFDLEKSRDMVGARRMA